jgi:putative flippase GtrA
MKNAAPRTPRGGERPAALAARYLLFAIIAGAMNLGAQAMVSAIAPVQPLALSILAGTGVGFTVKYLLDKRWIFFDGYNGAAKEAREIFLYGSFSVAMTFVFWGFEVGFLAIWGTNTAKYVGAVIGLAIGNFAKYLLDRTFTFSQEGRWRKPLDQAQAEVRSWN